jgi:peptide/nickel transport system substrate-binding protein
MLWQRHRSIAAVVIAAVTLSVFLSSCGATNQTASKRGGTLTIADFFPLGSLEPADANVGTNSNYLQPLYAPLIRYATNGELEGVLATSWKYVGTNNETFQINLRAGVTFSNGKPVNAAAVVASIDDYKNGSGSGGQWLQACPTVKAINRTRLEIDCTKPDPDLPETLTDALLGGDIIAPGSSPTDPIGAGEYTLDAARTTAGSKYTYLANPRYFDQRAIHWSKIVVETIGNPSAGLAAVQSGQAQVNFTAVAPIFGAARAAGVSQTFAGGVFQGVELANRSSGGTNPLGNLKVRQALEYAVNRPAVNTTANGAYGTPTDQIGIPAEPTTWDAAVNDYYPYDVTKAKSLLIQAGYPKGFTINVEDEGIDATETQAVMQYWNAIGVKTNVTFDSTAQGWQHHVLSGSFPAIGYGYGALPMYLEAINWFAPIKNIYNPLVSSDPAITNLVSAAETAPAAKQIIDWQKVEAAGVKQAWYVGIAVVDVGWQYSDAVSVPKDTRLYRPNDIDITPRS